MRAKEIYDFKQNDNSLGCYQYCVPLAKKKIKQTNKTKQKRE